MLPQTPRGNPYCFSLRSIEGLDGAHFFVVVSAYAMKTAFLALLPYLPVGPQKPKIVIFSLANLSGRLFKKAQNAVFYKVNGAKNKEVGSVESFY